VNHVCIRTFLDDKERLREFKSRAKEVRPAQRQERRDNRQLVQRAIGNWFGLTNCLLWQVNVPSY
jgi:hypothetical protein